MTLREEIRAWLAEHLDGEFAHARGLGGPGREHESHDVRLAWERLLGEAGWTCLGWPRQYGGRDATLEEQVAFHEEYARAAAPARVGHIGEGLIGPTIIDHGTEEQRRRFLPPIRRGEELWCQGYSEPDAGSDLAGVRTRAHLEDGHWVITGQKVWTSLAHVADWCFVIARTEPGSQRHRGLSYLLVPMDQPGVEVRPIVQMTGTSEFNEVFFDGARTPAANVLGAPGEGWRVAMATLGYERGASTLGQQIGFQREFAGVVETARRTGAAADPVLRDRLVQSWLELQIMRLNALRTMTSLSAGEPGPEVSIGKLYWSEWHRRLGELAQAVQGREGLVADGPPYELNDLQRLYLFSRADTIYAGSSEIQRNIIAERTLGLPKG
ncbi:MULTISPECIES: acyl-CoA dehydrogenase family protein [Streptosporangium]|uniref:Alkylation response protein AidB-like acyl-CoA dehydrogenase n=1 Tax=Streptosporangium brasiliense TaxID=47480 RepID=A0ABT9QW27_9ACTN|nr:acyl-CoA dehydrogenase family protein [Streptosporangium brasiliense]MDP9861165.1 alkylation response protein AidB-like acyl-CoA dehydrogenase [Streptosporangium brasiliense]